jgi:hypothetical protein
MKIPHYLKHKPVVAVEDYDQLDGRHANKTDAYGLSLGLAQWNDRGKVEVSAKVWRHTGEKWSRQSEELPLHRVLDLALLICRAQQALDAAPNESGAFDTDKAELGSIPLPQQREMTLSVFTANEDIDEDIMLFTKALKAEEPWLTQRFQQLAKELAKLSCNP